LLWISALWSWIMCMIFARKLVPSSSWLMKGLPISSSGDNRQNFISDGLVSKLARSVEDNIGFVEDSRPSDGKMHRIFASPLNTERSLEHATT
jgi:hypothetical protein